MANINNIQILTYLYINYPFSSLILSILSIFSLQSALYFIVNPFIVQTDVSPIFLFLVTNPFPFNNLPI